MASISLRPAARNARVGAFAFLNSAGTLRPVMYTNTSSMFISALPAVSRNGMFLSTKVSAILGLTYSVAMIVGRPVFCVWRRIWPKLARSSRRFTSTAKGPIVRPLTIRRWRRASGSVLSIVWRAIAGLSSSGRMPVIRWKASRACSRIAFSVPRSFIVFISYICSHSVNNSN